MTGNIRFGNLMQDVLWCFSQVKGTIDIGITEGRFIFPFVALSKENLFFMYSLLDQHRVYLITCC
uniref:Uncharacterized protein n=1 Tax=Terrapene triunguis TaxID=2587831 RepID=A0A674JRN3_9SAUR